jgi:hypothetical protein
MDYNQLEISLISTFEQYIQFLQTENFWKDIISFCLYTDEDCMSISYLFNTLPHLNKHTDDEFYLTYKYNPAEWFSDNNYNNNILNDLLSDIRNNLKNTVLNEKNNNKHKKYFINCCLSVLKNVSIPNVFSLFMMSDYFDKKDILKWNKPIIPRENIIEFKKWVDLEL